MTEETIKIILIEGDDEKELNATNLDTVRAIKLAWAEIKQDTKNRVRYEKVPVRFWLPMEASVAEPIDFVSGPFKTVLGHWKGVTTLV